jgi:diguanylate cyclase (GGDEF)-like protein
MPPSLTATDVAFAMVAVMQAVLACVWLLGSWLAGEMKRATLHWAAYAALSAACFAALTAALHAHAAPQAEMLRAIGNLCGIVALMALQRGIWIFIGHPPRLRAHLLALGVALVAAYVGLSPSGGALRVSLNCTVLVLLSASMALDLHRHSRDRLRLRRPWLMAAPLLAAVAGFAFRGIRGALRPDTVASEMTIDSALNVDSALAYTIIALSFHAVLMALVVRRLLGDLQHRSRHDGLTGLLNRHAIEEAMQAQMQRSRRTGETFSVLMLDLDHFKAINDRFGHAVGDRALKHAATTLTSGLREVDRLARIGGEEFLVLMPDAGPEAARTVAERLRAHLDANPLPIDATSVPLSVSIGIAQWSAAVEDASRLLVRADAALYQAKVEGRNRVIAATEPPQEEDQATPVPASFVYFAYGSNMSSRRLGRRTPSARAIGIGHLRGHRLMWHKRGSDGSAKCDIRETGRAEDIVWGVLFEIAAAEKSFLDQAEGLDSAYEYKNVRVRVESQDVEAGAYFAVAPGAAPPPYDWYLAFVLAGAMEHGLPSHYASELRSLTAVVDPDADRRERNLAILRNAESSSSGARARSGPA